MRKPVTVFLVACVVTVSHTVPCHGAVADTDAQIDRMAVEDFERASANVSSGVEMVEQERRAQFDRLIDDLLGGAMQDEVAYTGPVAAKLKAADKEFTGQLADRKVEAVRRVIIRAKDRGDKELVARAEKAIAARDGVKTRLQSCGGASAGGEGGVSLAVFTSLGVELAEAMVMKCGLLQVISMEKDRVEDFLTRFSRPIYEEVLPKQDEKGRIVKQGRQYPRLTWLRKKRLTFKILKLVHGGYTFDAEKPAEEAVEAYPDESHFHLLYAYIKLINKSNPNATSEGYGYLVQTYEELRTGKLAYNMVRVGARLNQLDEATMWKLIDHANFNDDDDDLANLFNLYMVVNLKKEDWGNARRLYDRLLKGPDPRKAGMLLPAFKFIVLLHDGEFARVSAEVDVSTLGALVQKARD